MKYKCQYLQEISANAHETRDSISFILYAGCLGLSPVISAKIHSLCVAAWNSEKLTKPGNFSGVQGHRRRYHGKGRQQWFLW